LQKNNIFIVGLNLRLCLLYCRWTVFIMLGLVVCNAAGAKLMWIGMVMGWKYPVWLCLWSLAGTALPCI